MSERPVEASGLIARRAKRQGQASRSRRTQAAKAAQVITDRRVVASAALLASGLGAERAHHAVTTPDQPAAKVAKAPTPAPSPRFDGYGETGVTVDGVRASMRARGVLPGDGRPVARQRPDGTWNVAMPEDPRRAVDPLSGEVSNPTEGEIDLSGTGGELGPPPIEETGGTPADSTETE